MPDLARLSTETMYVDWYGTWPGNTPQLGIMLLSNGDRGAGYRGGATGGHRDHPPVPGLSGVGGAASER